MIYIAHRGLKQIENKVIGIKSASQKFEMVEIDIQFNSNNVIVLCHDKHDRDEVNIDTFEDICKIKTPIQLLIDIKAIGISTKTLSNMIVTTILKYPQHAYELCSFNENCIFELTSLRKLYNLTYKLGLISSGIPLIHTKNILNLDFISLNINLIDKKTIQYFQDQYIYVYVWSSHEYELEDYIDMNVDGIIMDCYDEL